MFKRYLAEYLEDCMCQINGSNCCFKKKKKINFTLKEVFCGSYSLGLFSPPTYNSHCSYSLYHYTGDFRK